MRELAFITAVSWLGDHRLELTFRDGVHGEIDLATDLQEFPGALARLRDVDVFRQVSVDPDWDTLIWPGDIELDSDVLYSRITGAPLPGQHVV